MEDRLCDVDTTSSSLEAYILSIRSIITEQRRQLDLAAFALKTEKAKRVRCERECAEHARKSQSMALLEAQLTSQQRQHEEIVAEAQRERERRIHAEDESERLRQQCDTLQQQLRAQQQLLHERELLFNELLGTLHAAVPCDSATVAPVPPHHCADAEVGYRIEEPSSEWFRVRRLRCQHACAAKT